MNVGNFTIVPPTERTRLFDLAVQNIILAVNFYLLAFPLSILGVLTNVANVIVYYKMGFSESSNVNFFTLSTFDLLFSIISLVGRFVYGPFFQGLSNYLFLRYIVLCLTRAMFVTTCGSAMMTALISTERCLSVVFPLKVKTMLSYRRRLCVLLTIVAYHVAFLVILYADPGPPYEMFSQKDARYYFYFYALPLNICFFVVILNTIFLVIRLRLSQQWRKNTTVQSTRNTDKESKLARTIIAISIIFILCYFPTVALFITQIVYPPFNYSDVRFNSLNVLIQDYNAIFQIFSSSVNIVFYYRMSSRYKQIFKTCFAIRKSKEPKNRKAANAT